MNNKSLAILFSGFLAATAAAQTWTIGPRMMVPRYSLGVVTYHDTLYAAAGFTDGAAFDSVKGKALERLDASSWTSLPSSPTSQEGSVAAAVGGKIYVIGGYGPTDLVRIYDIAARTWEPGPPAPDSLYWATSQTVGDSVYVIGGFSPGRPGASVRKSVLVLNTIARTWSKGPDLPVGIQNPSSALFGGKIYVFGGWAQDWKLDLAAGTWQLVPGGPCDVSYGAAVAAGGKIYLMGGTLGDIGGGVKRVLILDPVTETWSSGPELAIGLHGGGAVAVDGKVYLVGGRNCNANATDTTQVLDLAKGRVTRNVGGPNTIRFDTSTDTTAVSIKFTAVTGTGSATVIRYPGPPWAVSFAGPAPGFVSQYRWVVHHSGISGTSGEVQFAIDLIRSGATHPSSVTVYTRTTEGTGAFTPLPTSFDSVKRLLKAAVSGPGEFIFGSDDNPLVGVPYEHGLPGEFTLFQNFPNPFNPATTIGYTLPQKSHVSLTVFNILGQMVGELVNQVAEPGYHTVKFDAGNLAGGVYFYRLTAGPRVSVKKLLLLK